LTCENPGLLKIVEEAVLAEHARRPKSPIYLVGDSFGGSLSLAVAARNPKLDLVLILANPGELNEIHFKYYWALG